MLPKIFHQIWLNGKIPEPLYYFSKHMLELHPGWEYKFWNEENMPKLINQESFEFYNKVIFKSDVLRYEILYKFGGIYVDFDFLFYKNLEPLISEDYFLVFDVDNVHINNCIMGFSQENPIIKYVIDEVPRVLSLAKKIKDGRDNLQIGLNSIGPRFLQRTLSKFPNLKFIDRRFTHPFGTKEVVENQLKNFPDAYGAHFWCSHNGSNIIEAHKRLPCYIRREHAQEKQVRQSYPQGQNFLQ